DLADGVAHDPPEVDRLLERPGAAGLPVLELRDRDLAAHHDDVGLHERLAGHAAGAVDRQAGVEHAVGDQVRDLVGMTLTDRFGGKNEGFSHGNSGNEGNCVFASHKSNINVYAFHDISARPPPPVLAS